MILAGDSCAAKASARTLAREERRGQESRGPRCLQGVKRRGNEREEERTGPASSEVGSYNGSVSSGAFESLRHAF